LELLRGWWILLTSRHLLAEIVQFFVNGPFAKGKDTQQKSLSNKEYLVCLPCYYQ